MKTHSNLPNFTSKQLEFINGSLLGDGWLSGNKNKPHQNWHYSLLQSKLDNNGVDKGKYMNWCYSVISPYSCRIRDRIMKNNLKFTLKKDAYNCYEFNTHRHPIWNAFAKKWYLHDEKGIPIRNKIERIIKIVPKDLKLTPLTVCIWYMEDGYNAQKDANITLCTNGFSIEECNFLRERLKEDLGVSHTSIQYDRKQPTIYIGTKSYFDFINIIKPCVEWDCFQYKIDTSGYNKVHQSGENHSQAKLKDADIPEIFEFYHEGIIQKEIAKKYGVRTSTIALILNGKRFTHLNITPKEPSNHCKPHLTKEQKEAIAAMKQQGCKQKDIAEKFGVNTATVYRTLKSQYMRK